LAYRLGSAETLERLVSESLREAAALVSEVPTETTRRLYMATLAAIRWNPLIRTHYAQLRERGRPAKVAIVACMRRLLTILNAMLRERTPWQPA
jgi:transposase